MPPISGKSDGRREQRAHEGFKQVSPPAGRGWSDTPGQDLQASMTYPSQCHQGGAGLLVLLNTNNSAVQASQASAGGNPAPPHINIGCTHAPPPLPPPATCMLACLCSPASTPAQPGRLLSWRQGRCSSLRMRMGRTCRAADWQQGTWHGWMEGGRSGGVRRAVWRESWESLHAAPPVLPSNPHCCTAAIPTHLPTHLPSTPAAHATHQRVAPLPLALLLERLLLGPWAPWPPWAPACEYAVAAPHASRGSARQCSAGRKQSSSVQVKPVRRAGAAIRSHARLAQDSARCVSLAARAEQGAQAACPARGSDRQRSAGQCSAVQCRTVQCRTPKWHAPPQQEAGGLTHLGGRRHSSGALVLGISP